MSDAGDRRRIFGDTGWVTLRLQLSLFQLLLFLAVLAMAGVVWIATSTMVQRLARVHLSHEQVEAALEIDGSFNRLSEQLAELLLLGAAAVLLGGFFYRSIGPPLRGPGAAAEAVESGDLKLVDVYVRHLRRKLDEGEQRPMLRTVRGLGYLLDRPDADP